MSSSEIQLHPTWCTLHVSHSDPDPSSTCIPASTLHAGKLAQDPGSILMFEILELHPSKDTVWQNGLKKKTQQFVAYRRLISPTEISICLGWKAGRRFTKPMAPETGRSSNTYLWQSRLQTYIEQTR
jgi:hypothetical protein